MMVTHDSFAASFAASFASRILFVKDGAVFNEIRKRRHAPQRLLQPHHGSGHVPGR